jgi:hypothetical protein
VLGGDEDPVWSAADFVAPLPDDVVDAFHGGATDTVAEYTSSRH